MFSRIFQEQIVRSANQTIPRLLCHLTVDCRLYQPSTGPCPESYEPAHTLKTYFTNNKIYFL